jgi:hypothetical protein
MLSESGPATAVPNTATGAGSTTVIRLSVESLPPGPCTPSLTV